jgi:hypothetical protein
MVRFIVPTNGQFSMKMNYENIADNSFTYVIYIKTAEGIISYTHVNSQMIEYRSYFLHKNDVIYIGYMHSIIDNGFFTLRIFEDPTQSNNVETISLNLAVNCTTLTSTSLYFSFTSSYIDTHKIETLGYVYKSTKLRIYDAYGGFVASSTVGQYPENAKIIIDTLQHNTKYYIVVNFIDYSAGSIQLCVSDCELGYKVDWYNIPKYYYDNVTMDLPTYFIHASFVNPTYLTQQRERLHLKKYNAHGA